MHIGWRPAKSRVRLCLVIFCFSGVLLLIVHSTRVRYFPRYFVRPNVHNKWFEVVVPSRNVTQLTSLFRYPELLFSPPHVLNRSRYAIELVRYVGLDPSDPGLRAGRVLVVGSTTVLGSAVIRNLTLSNTPFVCIKSHFDFDLSGSDAWAALRHLAITQAIVIHQPLLFRRSRSDGGAYIEAQNAGYLRAVDALLGAHGIPVTFIASPPHFAVYEEFAARARVVFLPHVVDSRQPSDTENLVLRGCRECLRENRTTVEQFDSERISNLDIDQVAGWLMANFAVGFFRIDGNDSLAVRQLTLSSCDIQFRKSPHVFTRSNPLRNITQITFKNVLSARQLIRETLLKVTHFNPVYLSIVITGRNDDYGTGFLNRAQNFLNHLAESLSRVPLADIEIIWVDYATPSTNKPLHEMFTIPARLVGRVKFIIVPFRFHITFGAPIPFLEYVAKNIGIYRSSGEFVVAMNPDSLLPDNVFELCAQRAFNPGVFYSCTRRMMEAQSIESVEFQRINEPWQYPEGEQLASFRLLTPDKQQFGITYVPGLGDFTLLSKELWDALGGYLILETNTYVDHIFRAKMLKIVSGGYAAQLPNPVLHQYHEPVSSQRASKSMAYVNELLNDYLLYGKLTHEHDSYRDRPSWGFQEKTFQQVLL
jgi:hypothetical protein